MSEVSSLGQPTNCNTTPTTRNISTYYFYSHCHQTCHSGEQTTYQPGNGHSRKDTSGCHHTLQHHQFTLHQPELPADCTSHPLHSGKSQRFTILYAPMHQVAMHVMDHINAAMTGTLLPHVLPVDDLQKMLTHIEEVLPSTMHLAVSSKDTLHVYRYLFTHVLNPDEQFLLLIDMPIQDHRPELEIYQVFNLVILHGNLSACYDIHTKYLGITYDETKAVGILEQEFLTCQQANRQFCSINAPLQPLANPPSFITAIYDKDKAEIEKRCSLQIRHTNSAIIPMSIAPNLWILTSAPTSASTGITLICPDEAPKFIKTQMPIQIPCLPPPCSTTSQYFYLPPHYENHQLMINISLDTAKLHIMNISPPEFRIWHHLEDHWNGTQLHHLVNIPSVPIDQFYKHLINSNGPITPFITTGESIDDTASLWTLFSHTGIYITGIGLLIPAELGIFCCYFFWCQPARLAC